MVRLGRREKEIAPGRRGRTKNEVRDWIPSSRTV